MLFKLTNISIILFITTLLNFFTTYISWKRRKTKGGIYFALGMLGVTLWTLAAGLDYAAISIPLKVFFAKLEYTGYNSALSLLVTFSLSYVGYDNFWKSNWTKVFLALPLVSILLAWTNDLHGWLWSGFVISELGENTVIFEHGPGFVWAIIIGYLMVGVIVVNLWRASRQGSELSRRQARLLFFASIFPVASNLVYLFENEFINGIDWTSITFSISGLFFILALYGTRFLDIVPIARRTTFEYMSDGVLVLDAANHVIDFNQAAEKSLKLNENLLGSSINVVMADWPEIVELASSDLGETSHTTIIHAGHSVVFDTRLTLLEDDRGQGYGKLIVFRNITQRHQAEKALRQSEEKFNKAFQSSPDAILITRLDDGQLIEVNDGFCKIMGYSRQEALSNSTVNLSLWAHPQDREQMIVTLREKQRIENQEYQFRRKSGELLTGLLSAEIILLENEAHILSVLRDISKQKQVQELSRFRLELWEYSASHSLDELMQKALNEICSLTASPIGFYHFVEEDQKTLSLQAWSTRTLEEFCRAEGKGLHYNIDEAGVWVDAFHQRKPVIHNNYATLPHRKGMPAGHAEVVRQLVAPVLREKRVVSILGVGNKPSDYDENEVELVSTIADLVWTIVSHKQAEEKIQQTQIQLGEQQRELAVIEERQRMARDLHDSVNQSIHSMVLFSDTLAATLEKNNLERARHIMERLQESARQSLKETRLLLYEMQTEGPMRSVDLIQNLETRLATVERRAGIRSQVILEGLLEYCPPAWNENLFRITIEALNNALKHAQARSVQIVIRCFPARVELEVSDNGKGFELDNVNIGGMGLGNMSARAEELGGALTIQSNPGQGTKVRFVGEPNISDPKGQGDL